jgi:hypothetical protein
MAVHPTAGAHRNDDFDRLQQLSIFSALLEELQILLQSRSLLRFYFLRLLL